MNNRRNILRHLKEQCMIKITSLDKQLVKLLDHTTLPPHVAAVTPNAVDAEVVDKVQSLMDQISRYEDRLNLIETYDLDSLKEHDDLLNYDTYSK